jgi:hypothetical protein
MQVDVPKPLVSHTRASAPGPRSSSTTTSSPSRYSQRSGYGFAVAPSPPALLRS